MNKRKVLSILLLALITVTLAVSCSSNIDTPAANTEELAYVTFGNGHSRELGTSYLTEDYDKLFWFYTAHKTDSYGTTGQVELTDGLPTAAVSKNTDNSPKMGLSGQVGPFSQGAWDFTLYAYKEASKATLVYKSGVVPVILKGGDVKNVPVSVTTQGSTGTLEVKDAYFEWYNNQNTSLGIIGQGGGDAKPLIKFSLVNSNGVDIVPVTATIVFNDKVNNRFNIQNDFYKFTVPVGYYTGIVSVYLKQDATTGNGNIAIDNEGTPVYTQSFGVRIYGNATTYISGNMVEGVNSKVTFDVADQTMRVFTVNTTEATSVTTNITALNGNNESLGSDASENQKTTVSFPVGALDKTAVHQLDVKVTPIASAEQKFQVSGITQEEEINKTAVAGIDLKMVKIQKYSDGTTEQIEVTSFGKDSANNDRKVTITTYIATGLSGVEVKYLNSNNNLEHIAGPIENTTGTPSYDPATGKLVFETTHFSQYVVVSPVEAVNVNTGVPYTSLATAIADAKDGQIVKIMKDIAFDSRIIIESKNITLNLNGKTLTTGNSDPRFFNILNNSNVVITGNGRLTGLTESNAAQHNQNSLIKVENSILTIENGTFTAGGANGNGLYGIFVAEGGNLILGTTDNGPTITTYFAAVSSNNTTSPANIVVNSGTYKCTSSDNKAGSSATNRDKECAAFYLPASGNYEFKGGTLEGSKYAISTPYYNVNLKISINGGTFKGGVSSIFKGTETGSGSSTTDERVITITGGRFSSDPSAYVAEGYVAEKNNENKFVVSQVKAKIGNNYYSNLSTALTVAGKTATTSNPVEVDLLSDIELDSTLNVPANIILDGNNSSIISGKSIYVQAGDVIKNLTFRCPKNDANNASHLYAESLKGKLEIINCTFIDTQWDCIQITPVAGADITVSGCHFRNENNISQRYLHIEAKFNSKLNVPINVINNDFGSTNKVKNSILDIDYVDYVNCLTAYGNTFADSKESTIKYYDIYICGTSSDILNGSDAYDMFTRPCLEE